MGYDELSYLREFKKNETRKKKNGEKLLGCLGAIVAFLFVLVVGTLMNGWALSILWKWFVVPVFELPMLTIGQALGIGLIVGYFTSDLKRQEGTSKDSSYTEKLVYACIVTVLKPLLYLGIGWIYLQFM